MTAPTLTYSRAQIVLHWATLLLLIAAFVTHDAMKDALRALERAGADAAAAGPQPHAMIGIAVLVLTGVRLALRLTRGAPPAPAGQSRLVTLAAGAVHGALYLLLLALPLSGMAVWVGGLHDLGDLHEGLFVLLLVLVAGHAAAALVHHYVLKDNLLARMR